MAKAKQSNTRKPGGRDARGKPVSLKSESNRGMPPSDRRATAQRQGKLLRGAMGEEHTPTRKRSKD